jgi:uncharacterized protein involved in exopolysaccharide biosynthesis
MKSKESEEEFSLKELILKINPYFKKLLEQKLKFILINTIVLIISLSYLIYMIKPKYKSSVDILPSIQSSSPASLLGQVSGLISMAGINLGGGDNTGIYENIIFSESILHPVIYSKYKSIYYPDSVNLIQYFEIKSDNSLSQEKQDRYAFLKTIRYLSENEIVKTNLNKDNDLFTVSVTTYDPTISASIANKIINGLDKHLRTKIKTQVTEQRLYLEIRNQQVKDSLTKEEEKLKTFREKNRVIDQSPELLLKQGRLMRNVEILQTVFGEITKQLELAKISEIQDTPVLNVKEMAKEPLIKERSWKLMKLILIMTFSILISVIYLIFSSTIKNHIKNYYTSLGGN